MDSCFLCRPDRDLVYAQSESFTARLGLGAIVEGFTILATRDHVPSMFDLDAGKLEEFLDFSERVRCRISNLWAPAVVTEHGRIGLCGSDRPRKHEGHCFHAHQLLFPGMGGLVSALDASAFEPIVANSFLEARQSAGHLREYLYCEEPDGVVLVGHAPARLRRQFFRSAAASQVGHPEFSDWRLHPRLDIIDAARRTLSGIGQDVVATGSQ